MSKWNKLISKINSLSKNIRFDEIKKILESYGYTMYNPSSGSSHMVFRKQDSRTLSIPKNSPVKVAYIKMVRDIITQEEDHT